MNPRSTLLITTYERPDALACVFESLRRQSLFPNELIVADDGSGAETRLLIDGFREEMPFAVEHAWQPHEGFRACRSRNLALARARGEYIVQIDGDMVLHPRFIEDHLAAARPGYFVQGTRILLDRQRTNEVLAHGPREFTPLSPGLGAWRRLHAAYRPQLSRPLRTAANAFVAIKGCNQGFWRADLQAVNGYNEAIVGWGCEDKELAARLVFAGVKRTTLLFAGIAYHLHHPPASRDRHDLNRSILAHTLRARRARSAAGLDGHATDSS